MKFPTDRHQLLKATLAEARGLVLDFDGPICALFAGLPPDNVAEYLREELQQGARVHTPDSILRSGDPFDVLQFALTLGGSKALQVESAFATFEAEAVRSAVPTVGCVELINAWNASGRPAVIVSNNSRLAVESYCRQHLSGKIFAIHAREYANASRLKPDAYLLTRAQAALSATPAELVFVGDSISDVIAGKAAGIPTIGYANKPGKAASLSQAGAELIIESMVSLAQTV